MTALFLGTDPGSVPPSLLPTSLSPVRMGSYDASSFLLSSLSPVRTGSYDASSFLLSLLEPVLTGDFRLIKAPVLTFHQHCYPWLQRINRLSYRLPHSLGADDGIENQVFEFRSRSRYIARPGEVVAIPSPI